MRELKGVWWTINSKQIPGTLTITDENKIILITYEALQEPRIINGFSEGERITLVDGQLDRTDVYYKPEEKQEFKDIVIEKNDAMQYCTYTYIAEMVILGHDYKRKGDIRLRSLELKYTNLEEWVNWELESPEIEQTEENIIVKFKKILPKVAKLEKFDLIIGNPHMLIQKEHNIQVHSEISIMVENMPNPYIKSQKEIIRCIQFFLILCTGDNINVTKVKATDFYGRDVELILGHGTSNYENRSILKNIIKYEDIKDNLEEVLKNWIELYIDNELLIVNFINLQRGEKLLVSEYTNLMTAIENLYLVITKQKKTNEHFAEMVKKLLRDTNFILNLSEKEIDNIANKIKNIRRYFVHSNKTQRKLANDIPFITHIVTVLIEVIRSRIMMEIGIDKKKIEDYYKNIKQLEVVKEYVVGDIAQEEVEEINTSKVGDIAEEVVKDENIKEENKMIIEPLSDKEKEDIAELNALSGTRYRENDYNLSNSNDLIQATENLTAEYMDYLHYWLELENIMENFDQSIEVFHPEKWMKQTKEGNTGNILVDEAFSSLYDASDNMCELHEQAEERCIEIWKFLLSGDDQKAKEYFLGDTSKYTKEELLNALDETIENITEVRYENQVQNDAMNFAKEIIMYAEEAKAEK